MARDEGQFVGFMLGGGHYGVDIMRVEEIIRYTEITPVPKAPHFLEGIINLRGRIIPVIDLRKRLSIVSTAGDINDTRIIVMKFESRYLGFLVDKVEQVLTIASADIGEAPATSAVAKKYIAGVARLERTMVVILDVLKIFSADEESALQSMKF